MDIKKLAPWNWFKHEDEKTADDIPVHHRAPQPSREITQGNFISRLNRDIDRFLDDTIRDMGFSSQWPQKMGSLFKDTVLKPEMNVSCSGQTYSITIEVPGVDKDDISVEVTGRTLTIKGEKRLSKEERDTHYYHMERSYGAFRRVLSLPDDAVDADIEASFKNGILTLTIPKKNVSQPLHKPIPIKAA